MSTPAGDWTTLVPVTGEAVALDLRVAQFPSRMLALALDLALQLLVLYGLLLLAMSIAASSDSAVAAAVVLLAVVGAIVGMPTLIETLTRGRSIGKIAAGLRVVRDDGGPVRFRHSFVRALFMIVDFWMTGGFVGIVSSLSSKQGKRLGDHFAGTVVVRERVPSFVRTDQIVYAMPPELEPWAASLDVSRLPDVSALQARQLLARAGGLAPETRSTMATQLAAEFSAYVTPPPPPGVHAEVYLHTVLTERMRRAFQSRPTPSRPTPGRPTRNRPASGGAAPAPAQVAPVVATTSSNSPGSGPFQAPS